MRWPFRREAQITDQTELEIPAEVQDYYQAERRERRGVAWLLGLGTLVVTLLLALGLFFGGRWVYRKATHKNSTASTAKTGKPAQVATEKPPQTSSTNTSQSPSSSSSAPATSTPTPAPTTPSSNSTAPSPSSPTQSSNPSPSQTSTTPSSTAPANSQAATGKGAGMPNTGPGDVIAIFAIISLAAAIGHNLVASYRPTRSS